MKTLYLTLLFVPFILCAQGFETVKNSLKTKYEYITDLNKDIAIARSETEKYTLLDYKGRELFKPKYSYLAINQYGWIQATTNQNNKYKRGYIYKDGSVRIPIIYNYVYMPSPSGIIVKQNNKKGVIDTIGNSVIPIEYDEIVNAGNDYYFVQKMGLNALFKQNDRLTDFIYKTATQFTNGNSAVLFNNNSTTIIDTTGRTLFPAIKEHEITKTYDNFAIIKNNKNLYGTIGLDGKFQIPCTYKKIELSGNDFIVETGKLKGLISSDNKELIPPLYKDIRAAGKNYIIDYGKGIVTRNNTPVIPGRYDYIKWHYNHFIIAELGDKSAIYDENGKVLLPFEYTFCGIWHNIIFCMKENKCYLLNLNKPTLTVEVENADSFKGYQGISLDFKSYIIFRNLTKYGILDVNLKIQAEAIYDDLDYIENTNGLIAKLNGKFGVINSEGKIIVPIIYDSFSFVKEFITFKKGDKTFVFQVYGELITETFPTISSQ